MRAKAFLACCVVALAGAWLSESADAASTCGGSADEFGREVQCEIAQGPVPGVEVGGSQGARLPAGWSVDVRFTYAIGQYGGATPEGPYPCDPDTGAGVSIDDVGDEPAGWPGRLGWVSVRDAAGQVAAADLSCFGDGVSLPAWLPPTRGEIEAALAAAPWPASTIGLDPAVEGLTGLETRYWSTTPGAQPIGVTVGNASVVGTAQPTSYRWRTGDGATAASSVAGSPQAPAVTHVYDVKGPYVVTLEVVWQADVEVVTALPSGGELRFRQDPPPAPVTVAGTRDLPVVEVRTILIPNGP